MRRFAQRLAPVAAFGLLAASLVSCQQTQLPEGLYARMSTSKGQFTIRLEFEKAPLTVGNFVGLAEGTLDAQRGKRYFDSLSFHRVVPDFVVQSGDPAGNGSGGPGYSFPDEISPDLKYDAAGVVGMANAGKDTNGSQFFVTLKEAPFLNGGYSVFGRVTEGMDVVRAIAVGDKLVKVEILRSGAAAKAFKSDQAAWDQRVSVLAAAVRQKAAAALEVELARISKAWPDLVRDADGIFQKTLKEGSGPLPQKGQTVSLSYKGTLMDGKVFDQSSLHGGPFSFKVGLGEVIPGWDRIVSTMKKGERRFVVIPPELAYGAAGAGGVIPPNAFLAFEMELLGIK